MLEVFGNLLVKPNRTCLVPATSLLPESIPIRSTLYTGVNRPLDSGMVALVTVKSHNLPALPNSVRAHNGIVFGTVPHLLEPIWSYVPEFVGDKFHKDRRSSTFQRHPDSNNPISCGAKTSSLTLLMVSSTTAWTQCTPMGWCRMPVRQCFGGSALLPGPCSGHCCLRPSIWHMTYQTRLRHSNKLAAAVQHSTAAC